MRAVGHWRIGYAIDVACRGRSACGKVLPWVAFAVLALGLVLGFVGAVGAVRTVGAIVVAGVLGTVRSVRAMRAVSTVGGVSAVVVIIAVAVLVACVLRGGFVRALRVLSVFHVSSSFFIFGMAPKIVCPKKTKRHSMDKTK